MITKEQCRAARSFLGLKQADLAQDCGLSKAAITHFESGLFSPRAENMANIRTALEKRGIEFVGTYGVQRRQVRFQVLDTREDAGALPKLWDDIFATLRDTGGEVLISYLDERAAFQAYPEKFNHHLERMKDAGISERILVCEGDGFFVQDEACYRWLRRDVYKAGMTSFLYGRKLGLQFWGGHFILVIEHPEIYEEEKRRFEFLWDAADIPPRIL